MRGFNSNIQNIYMHLKDRLDETSDNFQEICEIKINEPKK